MLTPRILRILRPGHRHHNRPAGDQTRDWHRGANCFTNIGIQQVTELSALCCRSVWCYYWETVEMMRCWPCWVSTLTIIICNDIKKVESRHNKSSGANDMYAGWLGPTLIINLITWSQPRPLRDQGTLAPPARPWIQTGIISRLKSEPVIVTWPGCVIIIWSPSQGAE